jgi:hypothetical protein
MTTPTHMTPYPRYYITSCTIIISTDSWDTTYLRMPHMSHSPITPMTIPELVGCFGAPFHVVPLSYSFFIFRSHSFSTEVTRAVHIMALVFSGGACRWYLPSRSPRSEFPTRQASSYLVCRIAPQFIFWRKPKTTQRLALDSPRRLVVPSALSALS